MPIKKSRILTATDTDPGGTTRVELSAFPTPVFVPPDPGNSDRIILMQWVAEGGTITPYTPPTP